MNYIYHIVTIPTSFVDHEVKMTTYNKKQLEAYRKTEEFKQAWNDPTCMRGTFDKEELALEAVKNYPHDLYEYYYGWLVIERHELNTIDGFAIMDDGKCERWFQWNSKNEEYEEVSKPGCLKHICAFAR